MLTAVQFSVIFWCHFKYWHN